jgi:prevent-host-death family protein
VTKTISATQAKNQFGALVESISSGEGDIIVENRGKPIVAIIPASRYEDLERFDKEEKRRKAIENIRRLREEISARNAYLTEEERADFIEQLVDEAAASMFAKGIVRYKE